MFGLILCVRHCSCWNEDLKLSDDRIDGGKNKPKLNCCPHHKLLELTGELSLFVFVAYAFSFSFAQLNSLKDVSTRLAERLVRV